MNNAIVTGGTRGIGLGIVKSLLEQGFHVLAVGTRAIESYDEFSTLFNKTPELFYVQADVSVQVERERILSSALTYFDRIDVLVNNAGVAPKKRTDLFELTEESVDRLFNINTKGTLFLSQIIANQMVKQKEKDGLKGIIVNISSVSSTIVSVDRADYCISKAGITMVTKLLASRLAKEAILVYEIQPGVIKSDMTAVVEGKYDKMFEEGLALINRWGTPEDIGEAVATLAEGRLKYTTGQIIYLDGGMTIPQL